MQGLSPEHLDGSQPLPTATPEGSPGQSEATVVTTPQVERTDSLERFRITNTREDFRLPSDSQRPFMTTEFFRRISCYLFWITRWAFSRCRRPRSFLVCR
jgi:hypothetical protein